MIDVALEAYREALKLALTDELTELPNLRSYERDMKTLIERCGSQGLSFALLAIDLDDLKGLNDIYGHPAVDEAFVQLGHDLQSVTRSQDRRANTSGYGYDRRREERRKLPDVQDMIYRTGGDEFIGVLIGVEESDLENFDERITTIYNAVRGVSVTAAHVPEVSYFSASIGVAIFPRDGEDATRLHRLADRNLYKAKKSPGIRINTG